MQRSCVVFFFCLTLCASAFPQDRGTIQCDPDMKQVPAWTAPGSAYVVDQLNCGQMVSFVGLERGYAKIQIGNRIAYVNAKYVKLPKMQAAQERQVGRSDSSESIVAQSGVNSGTLPRQESSKISPPNMGSQDGKGPIALEWKLRRGETLYYDMLARLTFTGGSSDNYEMTYGFIQKIMDVNEKGEATISMSLDHVKVNMKGEVSGFYDSRSDNPPRDDFGKAFSGLKDLSGTVRINQRGEILEVQGFTSNLQNPISQDQWMGNLSQMFPVLPPQSVKVGESWRNITKSPMPEMWDRSLNNMTIRELKDQSHAIIIQQSELLRISEQKAKQGNNSIESNSKSEIIWNLESGRPERISTKIELWSAKANDRGIGQWDVKLRQAGSGQSSTFLPDTPISSPEKPQRLRDVKKIYVDSFGNAEGADIIREKVINRIVKSGQLSVVEAIVQADAILTGVGEIRQGIHLSDGTGGTTYDATLLARLISKDRRILWMSEAKPGLTIPVPFIRQSVSSSVADKLVKNLLNAIKKDNK